MQRLRGLGAMLCAALWALAPPALAEDEPQVNMPDFAMVWFTSYACPDAPTDGPGATPETAIEIAEFSDLYYETFSGTEGEAAPAPPSPYECRWVRVRGFAQWMNYYDYRARLIASAAESYAGGAVSYILENFAEPSTRRADFAQRDVTIVGRFYDLCAAALRQQLASNQIWMTFGPCHYGADNGLMLRDVRIAAIHDSAPRYVLGRRSADFFRALTPVEDETRASAVAATRAWASAAQRGAGTLAEAVISAATAAGRSWSEDDIARLRRTYADPDSYESYVANHPRMRRLDPRRAEVEVLLDSMYVDRDRAHGCICLIDSCAESWPLTGFDAQTFLGDAVCTQLALRDGAWVWD